MKISKIFSLITLSIVFSSITAFAQMKVIASYPLSGDGRFDYLISSKTEKLYVSHGDRVNVMNKNNGKELAIIEGLSGVHGIALDYKNGKGYISNGTGNNISVFELSTNKILTTIETGKNPDAIIYEPFTKLIIVGNGKSESMTFIDPTTDKVVQTLELNGKPETAVSDSKGKLFVNIEDKNEILQIDLHTFKIDNHILLSPEGEEPSGLAIDKKDKLLFAGCSNKSLLIIDYSTGKKIGTYPIGENCDGVAYNDKTKTIFSSNGDGTLTILHKIKPTAYQLSTIKTQKGAKTLTIDKKTNSVYLSAATFETTKEINGKFKIVPNSFKILQVK